MDSKNHGSQIHIGNEAVALNRVDSLYGQAESYVTPRAVTVDRSLSLINQIKFFCCEYLHGVLFVFASLFFAVAVPAELVRPEKVKGIVTRAIKRTVDIIGALVGLFLSLPLFIIVALLVKLDSPGPIFYTQVRVGQNRRKGARRNYNRADVPQRRVRERRREDCMGMAFNVIKFRTMVHNAEKQSGPVWATRNDSRITRLGRFLRKTRLDEIPQFWNILRGDMSLVGPRPERPKFVEDLSTKVEGYTDRLSVKPGLTGLAQVSSGYDSDIASVARKVELDLEYINNWSLWLDIKILFRTVYVVLTGKGAN